VLLRLPLANCLSSEYGSSIISKRFVGSMDVGHM
jgi:hypothetical protein